MLTGPLIFSGAVGGGADWERAPSVDAGCPRVLFFFNTQRCTWSVTPPSIRPIKGYRSVAQQTGHETWLLLSLTIVNHIFD